MLEDTGAFTVSRQVFEVDTPEFGEASLTVDGTTYEGSHFDNSEGIDAPYTGALALPLSADGGRLGCEPTDFADIAAGAIVLVQRGVCSFEQKIDNATAADAGAVFIYNNERPPEEEASPDDQLTNVTSGARNPDDSPAATLPQSSGDTLAALIEAAPADAPVEGTAVIEKQFLTTQTFNVIADSIAGDPDDTVVIGAHLDGVAEGPGVNDNASGSAAVLALAEKIAASDVPNDKRIRLALWSAEEVGLLGSTAYVADLVENDPAEWERISAYLNYDMIGSENFTVGVYDANGRPTPPRASRSPRGPPRSSRCTPTTSTRSSSRGSTPSTPVAATTRRSSTTASPGGPVLGRRRHKTAEQVQQFGGTAGVFMDRNYHTVNDTLANVNTDAIDIFAPAIGHAAAALAWAAVEEPPVEPSPEPTPGEPSPSPPPSRRASRRRFRPRSRPRFRARRPRSRPVPARTDPIAVIWRHGIRRRRIPAPRDRPRHAGDRRDRRRHRYRDRASTRTRVTS